MPGVRETFDVLIIGGGVLGLAVASDQAGRGRSAAVIDPGHANASSVAAGMIAPAMEALLDPLMRPHAALLRSAADLWPAFAARHRLQLVEGGAAWIGEDASEQAAILKSLGFQAVLQDDRVIAAHDRRIEPGPALRRLAEGVMVFRATATHIERQAEVWRVRTDGADVISAQALVIATGSGAPIDGLTPKAEIAVRGVAPIRGQIVTVDRQPEITSRARDVYWTAGEDGGRLGATMEAGRRDLEPDPAATARLLGSAENVFGRPMRVVAELVGVRGATADGLPLVGRADAADLFLALAPRRNGWLLAPLVAEVIDAAMAGRPHPFADALDPFRRF